MAIALLLWRPFRGEKWVRVAILLPLVATPVAVGMMWRLIFDPNIGMANQVLGWVGIAPQPWLAGQHTALPTTIFIDVWQWTPMVVLILLAGLTSLSDEPQEAARIDGASTWQRFRHVTLPLLMPTVIVAILLRGIDALKTFDILYATKGTRRRLVPRGRDPQRVRLRPELRLQRVRRLLDRPHHLLPDHHRARCGP